MVVTLSGNMSVIRGRKNMSTKAMSLWEKVKKYNVVESIMNLVNRVSLKAEHERKELHKAKGVDNIDKQAYEKKLEESIAN